MCHLRGYIKRMVVNKRTVCTNIWQTCLSLCFIVLFQGSNVNTVYLNNSARPNDAFTGDNINRKPEANGLYYYNLKNTQTGPLNLIWEILTDYDFNVITTNLDKVCTKLLQLCNDVTVYYAEETPPPFWITVADTASAPVEVLLHGNIPWRAVYFRVAATSASTAATISITGTWSSIAKQNSSTCIDDTALIYVSNATRRGEERFLWSPTETEQQSLEIQFIATVFSSPDVSWEVKSRKVSMRNEATLPVRRKREAILLDTTEESTMTMEELTTDREETTLASGNSAVEEKDADTDEFVLIGTIVVAYVGMYTTFSFLLI